MKLCLTKKMIYLRLFLLSVLGALTLSLVSLYCLVKISDLVVEDYRYGYLLSVARSVERYNETRAISKINVDKLAVTPPTDHALSILDATEFGHPMGEAGNLKDPQRRAKPSLWLVSESGKVLSSNTSKVLPLTWEELGHPKQVHGIEVTDNQFFRPMTMTIKLDTTPTSFLVFHNTRSLFQGPFLLIQGIHTFTTAALAVFIALSISFYYLRKKSAGARTVLARLESGDLKARFEVKRFDEFGNLILDFNRMADEIERLVKRVGDTEASRSNLLQELGHDVRTPLTSLSTSFETLRSYYHQISDEDRDELFTMIGADIRYFKDLLEKLTIIAAIDVPQYKASTEKIDLADLLESELRNRQTSTGPVISWNFLKQDSAASELFGDYHLITRLFKNALDNAARYANQAISVKLITLRDRIEVQIIDDGPGLTDEAIRSFGTRRERRQLKERDLENFSLGLGSVIMKAIAEVHDGIVSIENFSSGKAASGACLKVVFRRA
ncbi:MAG TPA: ATP-binding protein [Bacteriovoracaceae bacterium]|nr:ATP-binding protein [Bacteriovoracaceae bacterium]